MPVLRYTCSGLHVRPMQEAIVFLYVHSTPSKSSGNILDLGILTEDPSRF